MAYYIKGIGDAATRTNEILPSFDARISHFIFKQDYGIAKDELFEFEGYTIDRGVVIGTGMAYAYGYFGLADTPIQINYVLPVTTSYSHIYAEIDLTVLPNKFSVKATPVSNTPSFNYTRDELLTVQNGIHQFPLYLVTLTASDITLTDRRELIAGTYAKDHTPSGGIVDSLNERLPKMTLIAQNKTVLIDPSGGGVLNISSPITLRPGDTFLANCEIQNVFGPISFSGIIMFNYNQIAALSLAVPQPSYNCVDFCEVTFKYNIDGTIDFSGKPATRVTPGATGLEISDGTAYTLLSLYRINFN